MDDWGMNRVFYDRDAKEIVRVSNGRCKLDHSSQEAFKLSHGETGTAACVYEPHEAVALRVVGLTKTGDPIIAYTYRGVRAESLSPLEDSAWPLEGGKVRPSRMIGRV